MTKNGEVTILVPERLADDGDNAMLSFAETMTIRTPEDNHSATGFLMRVKDRQKELRAQERALLDPINAAHKGVKDLFRPRLDMLDKAEALTKDAIVDWDRRERARVAAEQAAAEEKARKEREKLEARADKAEASGKVEKADALREQADLTLPAAVAPVDRKAGVQMRVTWKAEVTDFLSLVRAVATGQAPPDLLVADTKALNKLAAALKDHMHIPGVKAVKVEQVAAYTGRA